MAVKKSEVCVAGLEENMGEGFSPEIPVVQEYTPKNAVAEPPIKVRKKSKVKKNIYYSFLTLVLLFCLVQVGFGAILNISKTISYKTKINTLEKVRDEAEARNRDLKDDIKQFSTATSLEGIARNNLKMAGEDEVLVIINEPKSATANPSGGKQDKKSHNIIKRNKD